MREFIRAMHVPFFVVMFPAVHYVNRNLTSERLPPYIDPSTGLIIGGLGVSIVAAIVFAAILALFRERETGDQRDLPRPQRLLQPDDTALGVFYGGITIVFFWALLITGGIGPAWLGEILTVLLVPMGLPLLVLAPLAIGFHWATVLGYVLCPLWMSFLATLASDLIHRSTS